MSDETFEIRVHCPTNGRSEWCRVVGFLGAVLGGTTTYDGEGFWTEGDERVTEDTKVVTSVAERSELPERHENPEELAKEVAQFFKESTNEQTVMWEVRPVRTVGFE